MDGRRRFGRRGTVGVAAAVGLAAIGLAFGAVGLAVFAASGPGARGALENPGATTRYADVRIDGVPHVRQLPDFCGEACVEMWLRKLGHDIDQRAVFDLTGVDPAEGRGAYTRDLVRAVKRLGFDPGDVWYRVPAATAAFGLEQQWARLHADLTRGVPSIVCMRTSEKPSATEHFRLVLGYDAAHDAVLYHEPAEDDAALHRMPRARFLALWPLAYESATWTVVRLRLATDGPTPPPAAAGFRPADYALRVRSLRERLPSSFTILVEPPFVVVGDEEPSVVRQRAVSTVRWAAKKLKEKFFAADPEDIIDVWLFRDDESYRRNARALFGHEPHTPYGYSSPGNHALVMNIATGGGTLVHEIVHPFVRADFPDCPAWFNEGLGSLYEQCGERDGAIHGFTNWRLAGLQDAVREGVVPSFRALTRTTDEAFYDEDPGTNYAQARYLCYYLQEKGLLEQYYRDFRARGGVDPTGYATLRRVLELKSAKDVAAFEASWREWVLTLRFP